MYPPSFKFLGEHTFFPPLSLSHPHFLLTHIYSPSFKSLGKRTPPIRTRFKDRTSSPDADTISRTYTGALRRILNYEWRVGGVVE